MTDSNDLDAHSEEVYMALKRIQNSIRRATFQINPDMCANADKTSRMQGFIIHYIFKSEPREVQQKEIEQFFFMRRSSASEILAKMEAHDLIVRKASPLDARSKTIALTPKARKLHSEIQKYFKYLGVSMLQGVTEQERKSLLLILNKIQKNIDSL